MVSGDYKEIDLPTAFRLWPQLQTAWQDPSIPKKQLAITDKEYAELEEGSKIPIYDVLGRMLNFTLDEDKTNDLLEVGCSTAFLYRFMQMRQIRPRRYVGVDYSLAMVEAARSLQPDLDIHHAEATELPFRSCTFPVVLHGSVLLHTLDWKTAIMEAARVTSKWVIFHRTPYAEKDKTRYFTKKAYGLPCLEIVFGGEDFKEATDRARLYFTAISRISGTNQATILMRKL